MDHAQLPEMLTITQTAARTKNAGISEYTIRRWVHEGAFPVVQTGKKVLINWAVFVRFLNCDQDRRNDPQQINKDRRAYHGN